MKKTVLACAIVVMGTTLGGCAKQAKMDKAEPVAAGQPPLQENSAAGQAAAGAPAPLVPPSSAASTAEEDKLMTIYFDYDSHILSDASRQILTRNAEWLKKHPEARITIEGHADERGSDEYNLALGEKRARIAMEFLESLGVPSERLKTLSYGEEKPAVQGSDESAWSKNRRADFM